MLVSAHPEPVQCHLVDSILEQVTKGRLSLDGLIGAWSGEKLIGAGWLQIMPGRSAIVWQPEVLESAPVDLADSILEKNNKIAAEHDICVIQAVVSPGDSTAIARLLGADFERLANLRFLAWQSQQLEAREFEEISFEAYRMDQRPRLERVVEQTYQGTLDCPALNGVRKISDVVDGYIGTGEFSPENWFFVRGGGRDVGCLLMTDHPRDDQWELMYMALVPEARGNGWGRWIVEYAQHQLAQSGRSRLVLAVDADNEPAIKMYGKAGFQAIDERAVFLKVLD